MNQTITLSQSQSQTAPADQHVAGMGPIMQDQGAAFRVWAPNADSVSVIGDFNDWKSGAVPMQREDSGCWFVIVESANQHFSEYEFGLPARGKWTRRFSSDRRAFSDEFGGNASRDIEAIHQPHDGQSLRARVELPLYTVLIYSQDAS